MRIPKEIPFKIENLSDKRSFLENHFNVKFALNNLELMDKQFENFLKDKKLKQHFAAMFLTLTFLISTPHLALAEEYDGHDYFNYDNLMGFTQFER